MRMWSKYTHDKYIEELEKLGHMGVMMRDVQGDAQKELNDAQEKVNFIAYYIRHSCRECDKLMAYRGGGLYQCPKCKYSEMIVGQLLDEE